MSRTLMILIGLLIVSCSSPEMPSSTLEPISITPKIEKNADAFVEALKTQNWVYLQELAEEQYKQADYAKPGTLIFTVKMPTDIQVYFNSDWCAVSNELLKQNLEHMTIKFYFNGDQLGGEEVHHTTFVRMDHQVCSDSGVLMSNWPLGEYQLKCIVTFNQQIYNGLAYYDAGAYVSEYNVSVLK